MAYEMKLGWGNFTTYQSHHISTVLLFFSCNNNRQGFANPSTTHLYPSCAIGIDSTSSSYWFTI